jgi:hypothetical protein
MTPHVRRRNHPLPKGAAIALCAVLLGLCMPSFADAARPTFQVNDTNWGETSQLEVYKTGRKITDCRSGICR